MKGFHINIEAETKENTDYRRVLYTAKHLQLVVMSLAPGEAIGEEVHHLDQFIRIESGSVTAILDGEAFEVAAEHAIIIPEGVRHNIINGGSEVVKLYSIYAPPEHKDGTVHATKADEVEEHFDGVVTSEQE
jgi:mannose-6-phosphate isomerase-like protein (cupin superfamily)